MSLVQNTSDLLQGEAVLIVHLPDGGVTAIELHLTDFSVEVESIDISSFAGPAFVPGTVTLNLSGRVSKEVRLT